MANNTINWGQGAVNNNIGWGQAVSSNAISWGYIHQFSYGHPETNLVGLSNSLAILIADDYEARVLADGGVVESLGCVVNGLVALGITNESEYSELWATAYDVRVVADSGTTESLGCVRQGVQNLLII